MRIIWLMSGDGERGSQVAEIERHIRAPEHCTRDARVAGGMASSWGAGAAQDGGV
jgi:hypothetical protein